jgi:predicted RNA-binding Zn ribbon-like protein
MRKLPRSSRQFHGQRAKQRETTVVALPRYDTQADFDGFHPEEAGDDFREQNKMVERFVQDIQHPGLLIQFVTVHREHFATWLAGREITSELRAQYLADLGREHYEAKQG